MNKSPLIEKSDKLAFSVYRVSRKFPKEELYGLTSQLRRAVLSIVLNIIEGFARGSSKEYRQFLHTAYGSLKETKYLLFFAFRENYFNEKDYQEAINLAEEIGRMLWVSLKNIDQKIKK